MAAAKKKSSAHSRSKVSKRKVSKNKARSSSEENKTSPREMPLRNFVQEAWPLLEPATSLQWNWHLDLICEYLTLIKAKEFKNWVGQDKQGVIFNVPPRTMKSLLVTVLFPAWVWTTDPVRRFMFVSYSGALSTQHSVLRRNVMLSDWYRRHWKDTFRFAKDQNSKSHYSNSKTGVMFATAMKATATGLGGDILVFDDPLNPEQAVSDKERTAVNQRFDSTFRSRINDSNTGVKIIVMQRLHERDLTGHILAREKEHWIQVSLPAIAEREESWSYPQSGRSQGRDAGELLWPERLSEAFLDSLKTGMGSWAFAGQYQQNPAPLDGGIVKRAWIRFYRELPQRFDFLVQSWDCTFKDAENNDFVAGQVWGQLEGKYYMLPYRMYDRLDFGPTKAAIKACHAKFPAVKAVLIEDRANGPAIISELRREIAGVIAVSPEGGKVTRAQAIAPLWEAGSVCLPDPQIFDVPWLEDYIHNICTFPKAAHDDDMDATSQALTYMRNRSGSGILDYYRDASKKK